MERDYQKLALDLINIVDYDIYKECAWYIQEDGEDDLVDQVADWLERKFGS